MHLDFPAIENKFQRNLAINFIVAINYDYYGSFYSMLLFHAFVRIVAVRIGFTEIHI